MASNPNSEPGLMADPYASSGSSSLPPPPLASSQGGAPAASDDLFLNISSQPVTKPDFLFEENFDDNFRRSWGERLTYHVGLAYSTGA